MLDASEPARSAWLFEAVLRSDVAVVATDAGGCVRVWSAAAARLFGIARDEAEGRPLLELGLFADPVRLRQATAALRRVLAGETLAGEWTARRPDGTTVPVHTTHQPLVAGGEVVGALSLSTDLSDRDQVERALLREAMLDPLTQLPNRTVLRDALARLQLERRAAGTVAVLFVDLDSFKAVNDDHGHAVGDLVLRHVAQRLRATVREGDLVGRLGGDEFVLICRVGPGAGGAADLAGRIGAVLVAPVEVGDGLSVPVSASVGVAVADPGTDPDALLDRADRAMYRAKQAGRGGFHLDSGGQRHPG